MLDAVLARLSARQRMVLGMAVSVVGVVCFLSYELPRYLNSSDSLITLGCLCNDSVSFVQRNVSM